MHFKLLQPAEILQALGTRLRSQRLAQNLSQNELAQMAGLSLGAVRKLERSGLCTLDTLVRVAQVLGLVGELEPLFELQVQSIAQMQQAAAVQQRQRARRSAKIKGAGV